MAETRMSVLLPLQEDRATGEISVREWVHGQSVARESYEVILLAPGLDPVLEERARGMLTEHDRWVKVDTPDEYEMFNRGAELARGKYVFLTEAHCVPERDCLAAMLATLESRDLPGARGESKGESQGRLGRLEHDVYLDHLRPGGDDDHWRKVLIHSLAIRRDVFLEVGGFPAQYGDYCAWALAIALREAGHRLGYARGSAVRHVYTGELGILAAHVRDFARGEMRYYRDQPAELRARYLEEAPEWTNRMALTRAGAREALRAAVAARPTHPAVVALTLRHAAVAVAGPRADAAMARATALAWRLRTAAGAAAGRPSRSSYERFWEATAQAARKEYLAADGWLAAARPRPTAGIDVAAPEPGVLIGFHGLEHWEGRPFRWTSGLAVCELDVPEPGPHRVEIGLLPRRPRTAVDITVDGTRVPPAELEVTDEAIRFGVEGPGARRIGIVCAPTLPVRHGSPDRRTLGLAVTGIELARG